MCCMPWSYAICVQRIIPSVLIASISSILIFAFRHSMVFCSWRSCIILACVSILLVFCADAANPTKTRTPIETTTNTPTSSATLDIVDVENDPAEREHQFGAYSVLAITVVLIVTILLTYGFLVFECHYIPESVCTISVGMFAMCLCCVLRNNSALSVITFQSLSAQCQ